MPRVTYTADGGHYRVSGVGFDPGQTRDVDDDLAEYLTERDDFELADDTSDSESNGDDANSAESESTDEFDPEEFVDRTPMDDVVEDIQAGEVDDHLDAVAEAAERVGVEDAIGERRAELEG